MLHKLFKLASNIKLIGQKIFSSKFSIVDHTNPFILNKQPNTSYTINLSVALSIFTANTIFENYGNLHDVWDWTFQHRKRF